MQKCPAELVEVVYSRARVVLNPFLNLLHHPKVALASPLSSIPSLAALLRHDQSLLRGDLAFVYDSLRRILK